ncbi:HD domain-containing phosphohydrolase [Candidatus Latescibacterota bacterium]
MATQKYKEVDAENSFEDTMVKQKPDIHEKKCSMSDNLELSFSYSETDELQRNIMSLPNHNHILVVDDEKSLRHMLQCVIMDAGYKCSIAENGEEALKFLEINKADVVITDIDMPDLDGIELTRIIREKYDSDVIVMTGYAKDMSYENVIEKGARDFIQKPFSLKEMVIRLKHVLKERATISGLNKTEKELKISLLKLTRILEQTVNALASAFEKRDPYTAGHEQRVTQLACAISKELGLSEEEIEGIRIAGLLHDIGKISIPIDILNKPVKLSKHEFNLIKEHSQAGFEILKDVEFDQPIAQIVLQHHERMDGSGYPQGIEGDDIIRQARILAVSDVVEAMASHRPYRAALGIEMALGEIEKNKGVLYDLETANACLLLFKEERFTFK